MPIQIVFKLAEINDAKGVVVSELIYLIRKVGESVQIIVLFSAGSVLFSVWLRSDRNLILGTGQQEHTAEVEERELSFSAAVPS